MILNIDRNRNLFILRKNIKRIRRKAGKINTGDIRLVRLPIQFEFPETTKRGPFCETKITGSKKD